VRLLITGATGLVGRQIAAAGASLAGAEVVLSGRRQPGGSRPLEFHEADLLEAAEAEALVRSVRPTHIIHAAWETRPPTYWEDMANLAWVETTARIARAFAEVGGTRFVQVGSCTEYDWSGGLCIEGVTPDRPATRYGKSKLAAFRAVEAAAHDRFEAVEGRIFFVYGPGEDPARFVPAICRAHIEGRVPELSSGRQSRDFLHAEDIGRALVALAADGGPQGVVNIGGGSAVPLSRIASLLAEMADAPETGLGRIPDREGEPLVLAAQTDRLRSTGWAPTLSLEEGLARTLEWWRGEIEKEQGR
jgi:nucleoside-diphosphate-sugar epimerase